MDKYAGVKALPNPTGDGALLFTENEVYELKHGSSGWQWKKRDTQLNSKKWGYTTMYIPDEIADCTKKESKSWFTWWGENINSNVRN